jgi:hypothetical protein
LSDAGRTSSAVRGGSELFVSAEPPLVDYVLGSPAEVSVGVNDAVVGSDCQDCYRVKVSECDRMHQVIGLGQLSPFRLGLAGIII